MERQGTAEEILDQYQMALWENEALREGLDDEVARDLLSWGAQLAASQAEKITDGPPLAGRLQALTDFLRAVRAWLLATSAPVAATSAHSWWRYLRHRRPSFPPAMAPEAQSRFRVLVQRARAAGWAEHSCLTPEQVTARAWARSGGPVPQPSHWLGALISCFHSRE